MKAEYNDITYYDVRTTRLLTTTFVHTNPKKNTQNAYILMKTSNTNNNNNSLNEHCIDIMYSIHTPYYKRKDEDEQKEET